jgi:Fe2+ or Zn2+ uptake regulation protein
MAGIIRKLDKNFFAGRWAKATDRQRDLLSVIAMLDNCDEEFTVQDIVIQAKTIANPFSSSLVNQMLSTLTDAGLIYKNRHGKYSFAVPLLGQFILRQDIELNAP